MYALTYRRRFSLRNTVIKQVLSHHYNEGTDKLLVMVPTGCFEVCKWSRCAISLGQDWKTHFEAVELERLKREAEAK